MGTNTIVALLRFQHLPANSSTVCNILEQVLEYSPGLLDYCSEPAQARQHII